MIRPGRKALLLLCALCFWSGSSGAALAAPPEEPGRLARALDEAEKDLALFVEEGEEAESPWRERAPARAKAAIDATRLPWLGDRLAALGAGASEDERREAVLDTLRRVRAARGAMAPGPDVLTGRMRPAPGEPRRGAREVAREVLAERQFREQLAPETALEGDGAAVGETIGSWWQWLSNRVEALWNRRKDDDPGWFMEWLGGWLRPVGDVLGALPWRVITTILLVIVALILLRLASRYLGRTGAFGRAVLGPGGPNPLIADAMRHEARHFLSEGDRWLEKGDLRAAVRAYYVGVLSALHHRRLLKLDPAQTNWEHAARLVGQPEVHAKVVPATRTFDFVWYGRYVVEKERVLAIARTLEEIAGTEAATATGPAKAAAEEARPA